MLHKGFQDNVNRFSWTVVRPQLIKVWIKKAIKKGGFTIGGIAKRLGITQSALSQQINNDTISLARAADIAAIMSVSLSELVADEGEATSFVCPHCGKPLHIDIK